MVRDVRQTEIYTAKSLGPDPSSLEVDTAIAKLKKYKLPSSDQILAELIQAGCETLLRSINPFILFGIWKNCLISGRSLLLYQFTNRATNCL
jgi:hypothetical protein